MSFEKNNEVKKQQVDLSIPWKPNLVEKNAPKIETNDLFKKIDRLVSHTIRLNERSDRPLMDNLSLKELVPLLKDADLGQIVQSTIRFETQKMLAAPADYIAEKELEAVKVGVALHFGAFEVAIDRNSLHEFLVEVIDNSTIAELLGAQDFLKDIESARYEIVSYVEQVIYDAIKATNYLALCFADGILRVAEYTFDFAAGTVLSFANPKLAEALYKKDFTADIMKEIDSLYGANEFIAQIGDVVESIGTLATFMALCAVAAPETVAELTISIPGTALYFVEESGRSIKSLVSESGEYSGREFLVGVINGTISVCLLHLSPKICEKAKELANKSIPQVWQWLVEKGLSDKVSREAVSKAIGTLYGATRGGLQGILNETSRITNEKLAEITSIKDEAEISLRNSLANIGIGALLGAGSYAVKDLIIGSRWTSIEREQMHKETGWSYEFIDSIESVEQYEKYKQLVKETGLPPEVIARLLEQQDAADKVAQQYNAKFNPPERAKQKGYDDVMATKNGGISYEKSSFLYKKEDGTPGIVKIEATGNRDKDFDLANQLLGLDETPDGYVWHHVDDYDVKSNTITMQLVSDEAHNAGKPHSGGCAQYDTVHGPSYNPPRKEQ